jgi:hypothetical protein
MLALAQNAYLTVLRGTSTNAFGDIVDDNTAVYTNVPATLVETTKTVFDGAEQTPRTIRVAYCLVPSYLNVTTSDRIQDQATGQIYIVFGIQVPPTLVGIPVPTRLDLRRVTATTG